MGADELRRRFPVGSEDRAAHQQLHLRPAGVVDGVAMPADRVWVGAGQQEHLLDPLHRRHQRALVGEVTGDGVDRRREAAGWLTGARQSPDLLAPAQQLPDQRGADLAAAPDHQNQRPSSLRYGSLPGPNLEYGAGADQGRIADRID
jgi:hypothetical protein